MFKMIKNKKLKFKILLVVFMFLFSSLVVFAIEGVWHNPYGYENFYSSNEITPDPCERYPRDPEAGENVYIKIKTWAQEDGQSVWLTWKKNGNTQTAIGASWKYNADGGSYWEANMGSFSKGDDIEYTVHANQYGANEKTIGPFDFTVVGWDWVSSVTSYTTPGNNRLELSCSSDSGDFSPKINISFPETDYFRLQFAPDGSGATATGAASFTVSDQTTYYLVSTTDLKLKIYKNPYRMEVYESDGTTLITKEYNTLSTGRNLAFLTDGTSSVTKVEDNFYTPTTEKFFGFGQRYNDLNKRGDNVDIYTVNWYKDQDDKAYLPIPMFLNSNQYGFYLNSTYYSQFRIATDSSDKLTVRANAGGDTNKLLDFYLFSGDNYKNVLSDYADVTGKPTLPPVWAFGPWISANEWNKQSEIQDQIDEANDHDVPTSAIVLEAWSDEGTYYIFGDATYTAKAGSGTFSSSDFTYGGNWPTPTTLVTNAHNSGIKVLLWQIPVLKFTGSPSTQMSNDESYAIAQDYVVENSDGTPYRLPPVWFGNSLTPDFTNSTATSWWMSKREYLIDDIGIDGFKCDGGEFIWGRDLSFSDGRKGDEMRNAFPDIYVKAYYDYVNTQKSNTMTFSRAGGANAQLNPITWAGDQNSSWSAFQDAVRAGISASMSGVPFVTWDLAGFSGDIPATDLYKRSAAQAAFSPIMQLHSEQSGDPSPSQARTPWNMADRTSDSTCLSIYKKFADARMNLLPYLYTEAKYTSDNAVPMMRHMGIEFPDDSTALSQTFQYMLGGSLLVAPIVNDNEYNKSVYLPDTEWIDLWWGAQRPGDRSITYYAGLDAIPVFVKTGSIIPMNLNTDYDFADTIGNSVSAYNTLTFRIYPFNTTSYDWYDHVNSTSRTITSTEEYDLNKVTVSLPAIPVTSSLQVFTTQPSSVKLGASTLTEYTTLASFKNATSGWYYDSEQLFAYVKVGSSTSSRTITLEGIDKAPYEAEFGTLNSTTTNTNHTGYSGTGFVDGFATQGDSVEFDVYVKSAGTYTVDFTYSAGTEAASRSIYVNDSHATDLSLAKTTDWDTWGTASTNLTLTAGHNTIKVSYDADNSAGINLDNIIIHE